MGTSLLNGIERIVLASSNPGKVSEINALLEESGIEILAQTHFGVPEAEESGLSFIENALIKARNASLHTGLAAIADDSGLEVDALNGAPGIYSARYAGDAGDDVHNNRKLLAALAGLSPQLRSARFRCVMVFLRHPGDSSPLVAEGTWKGSILTAPKGNGGFGYDPLFQVSETNCSAAELDPIEKNYISHRGQALRALLSAMKSLTI